VRADGLIADWLIENPEKAKRYGLPHTKRQRSSIIRKLKDWRAEERRKGEA
jgi:hypothetical protein